MLINKGSCVVCRKLHEDVRGKRCYPAERFPRILNLSRSRFSGVSWSTGTEVEQSQKCYQPAVDTLQMSDNTCNNVVSVPWCCCLHLRRQTACSNYFSTSFDACTCQLETDQLLLLSSLSPHSAEAIIVPPWISRSPLIILFSGVRCTTCNSPPNVPITVMMVRCSAVLVCPKG